jgi:hypothetical protein
MKGNEGLYFRDPSRSGPAASLIFSIEGIYMKVSELSEAYYLRHGARMIEVRFAGWEHRIAIGLVGDGAECNDLGGKTSIDSDQGGAFCLWLDAKDYREIGRELQEAYESLPAAVSSREGIEKPPMIRRRTGVWSIQDFYQSLTGLDHAPETLEEWWNIPENGLSAATSGRVFYDPSGQFTEFRNRLAAYYPEDVRLKKIAACCMEMAQTGQYQYFRCLSQGELLTAQIALNKFIESAVSMMFLLNKTYRPIYQGMLHAMKELPVLGQCIYDMIQKFWEHNRLPNEKMERYNSYLIEGICAIIIRELKRQGISECCSAFLFEHGLCVQRKIVDPWLRSLDMAGV